MWQHSTRRLFLTWYSVHAGSKCSASGIYLLMYVYIMSLAPLQSRWVYPWKERKFLQLRPTYGSNWLKHHQRLQPPFIKTDLFQIAFPFCATSGFPCQLRFLYYRCMLREERGVAWVGTEHLTQTAAEEKPQQYVQSDHYIRSYHVIGELTYGLRLDLIWDSLPYGRSKSIRLSRWRVLLWPVIHSQTCHFVSFRSVHSTWLRCWQIKTANHVCCFSRSRSIISYVPTQSYTHAYTYNLHRVTSRRKATTICPVWPFHSLLSCHWRADVRLEVGPNLRWPPVWTLEVHSP